MGPDDSNLMSDEHIKLYVRRFWIYQVSELFKMGSGVGNVRTKPNAMPSNT